MATLETFNALSSIDLSTILTNALFAGRKAAIDFKEMDVMWPCGFAWINVKIRKNHRLASILREHGFTWNDYNKTYQYRGHSISGAQNMDYREKFLNVMVDHMRNNGIPCYVETRMD